MRWAMYLDMKIVPMRLVSTSSLAVCEEVFCNSWNCAIPAALTRTSIWPVRCCEWMGHVPVSLACLCSRTSRGHEGEGERESKGDTNPYTIQDGVVAAVGGDVHDGVGVGGLILAHVRRRCSGGGGQRGKAGVRKGWQTGAEIAQLVLLATEEGDEGALGGEAGGDGCPDTAVCAGNEAVAGTEGKEGGHWVCVCVRKRSGRGREIGLMVILLGRDGPKGKPGQLMLFVLAKKRVFVCR